LSRLLQCPSQAHRQQRRNRIITQQGTARAWRATPTAGRAGLPMGKAKLSAVALLGAHISSAVAELQSTSLAKTGVNYGPRRRGIDFRELSRILEPSQFAHTMLPLSLAARPALGCCTIAIQEIT